MWHGECGVCGVVSTNNNTVDQLFLLCHTHFDIILLLDKCSVKADVVSNHQLWWPCATDWLCCSPGRLQWYQVTGRWSLILPLKAVFNKSITTP